MTAMQAQISAAAAIAILRRHSRRIKLQHAETPRKFARRAGSRLAWPDLSVDAKQAWAQLPFELPARIG